MTHAQHKVWRFIIEFGKSHSRSPTFREIRRGTDIQISSVHEIIGRLVCNEHLILFPRDIEMSACYIPVIRYHGEA